ncbi:DUF6804 family protein [Chryseobacterium oryctis]|uniref:Uncharacterized protein n=1 Tax=Chryseobacterium oryctis TaxID=2952618 RepID=A0ABT3HLU9_9FLAO|nr:DUF6804 family protein [Chryseobacterium oryctis]MCW3160772.1 hypothetical protein [Chryseobacterium oryctis]
MKYLIIVAAICCFIGIVDLPLSYYFFLRILVSLMALIIIFNEFRSRSFWLIAFILIFILFNPFWPIYFYLKPFWIVIDILVGLLFFYYFSTLIPKKETKEPEAIDIQHEEITKTRDRIIK